MAFYLPMHTATRLALPVIGKVRAMNPNARIVAYGLYAQLNATLLRERGVSAVLGPESEGELVALASILAQEFLGAKIFVLRKKPFLQIIASI